MEPDYLHQEPTRTRCAGMGRYTRKGCRRRLVSDSVLYATQHEQMVLYVAEAQLLHKQGR